MTAVPVTLRGRMFPSARAAARAGGVHVNTLYRHLDLHGTLDHLNAPSSDRTPRPVEMDGATYPSIHPRRRSRPWRQPQHHPQEDRMTPQQSQALTIHDHSRHGRDNLRDSDLTRLNEVWPGLRKVFEEVQFLRDRVDALQDEVERLSLMNDH